MLECEHEDEEDSEPRGEVVLSWSGGVMEFWSDVVSVISSL